MEAEILIDIQFSKTNTLQSQLHRYLVEKISQGLLPPGTKLPTSRSLAQQLKISRNTVTEVFEQLKAEGFIESKPGSGVYINQTLPQDSTNLLKGKWQSNKNLPMLSEFAKSLSADGNEYDSSLPFTVGQPDLNAFPSQLWRQCERRSNNLIKLTKLDSAAGYLPLRESLQKYLSIHRGVSCDIEQIIITQGAQHALWLCAHILLNEGDSVLVENPGYKGARNAFLARQANMETIQVNSKGIKTAQLPTGGGSKLLYTTPTHQYPLGGILSASERIKLLDWATNTQRWIIEDDYDSEFHFSGRPIASLQGMATQTPVIYIGSFSKTLLPSLRLGYMIVPKPLMPIFVRTKLSQSGLSPLLSQATAAEFIIQGHFVRHLRRMRRLYQQKWQHLEALITSELNGLATPIMQSAGMHLALMVDNIDDNKLEDDFRKHGYGSTALSKYYHSPDKSSATKTGLTLGFANTNERDREYGIKLLRSLISTPQ